jgi:hypothetical protein
VTLAPLAAGDYTIEVGVRPGSDGGQPSGDSPGEHKVIIAIRVVR